MVTTGVSVAARVDIARNSFPEAQAPADPSFEVASIKSNRTEAPATTLFPLGPGAAYAANGGRFRATNQPLINYLRFAYRLGPGDLLDLPRWVYNERFDVEARANGEPAKDQMRLMMRSLLKDRSKLVVHTEQQTQAIFDLSIDLPVADTSVRQHRLHDDWRGRPRTDRGERRANGSNRRSAQNPTHRHRSPHPRPNWSSGTFDMSLEWSVVSDTVQASIAVQDDMPLRFLEALKTQLGLTLSSTKGPVDILVVDQVARPTEN